MPNTPEHLRNVTRSASFESNPPPVHHSDSAVAFAQPSTVHIGQIVRAGTIVTLIFGATLAAVCAATMHLRRGGKSR